MFVPAATQIIALRGFNVRDGNYAHMQCVVLTTIHASKAYLLVYEYVQCD